MSSIRQTRTYRGPEEHSVSHRVRRTITVIVCFLFFYHLLTFAFVTSVRISGDGMSPELTLGDRALVSRAAYGLQVPFLRARIGGSDPQRGDVVLYESPAGRRPPGMLRLADSVLRLLTLQRFSLSLHFGREWEGAPAVGRIVATPGDSMRIESHRVHVTTPAGRTVADIDERDGSVRVIRPEVPEGMYDALPLSGNVSERTLGEDEYWIEGDSRGTTLSSTHFGTVDSGSIRSRVFFRFYPLPRFRGVR